MLGGTAQGRAVAFHGPSVVVPAVVTVNGVRVDTDTYTLTVPAHVTTRWWTSSSRAA